MRAPIAWLAAPAIAQFGAPGAAVRPRDISAVAAGRLVLWEQSGRFAIRDPRERHHASPPAPVPTSAHRVDGCDRPHPGKYGVIYQEQRGTVGTIRRITPDGRDEQIAGGAASFDNAVADGTNAAWTRATGPDGKGGFEDIELWTARGDNLAEPRRITSLPAGPLPLLSIGSGWIAARLGPRDVRLWSITDGRERRLPAPPDLLWDGGPQGLVLAANKAWVKASPAGRPGNDVRHLVRLDLDALPSLPHHAQIGTADQREAQRLLLDGSTGP